MVRVLEASAAQLSQVFLKFANPDFRRYFSSQIPDPEIRVPFERTKKIKEKHKQRNKQSKAIYTNFYLFIYFVFRDRFWTGHKFVTQTC